MMRRHVHLWVAAVALMAVLALAGCGGSSPTATPTATVALATPTPTATQMMEPTATATPGATATPTPTMTPTPEATVSPTPQVTPTSTALPAEKASGVIGSVDPSQQGFLFIDSDSGANVQLTVEKDTKITVDGKSATMADVTALMTANVKYEPSTDVALTVDATSRY